MKASEVRLFDIHAHPSLKMFYIPWLTATLHAAVYSGAHFNPVSFRTRYANLASSPVKVIVNAHYVIEKAFLEEGFSALSKVFFWLAAPFYYGWLRTADPWKILQKQMDLLEHSEWETNRFVFGKERTRVRICRSYADILSLKANEIGLVHAIESAHSLGEPREGQSHEDFWNQTRERLRILKDRGVSMITLSHFYDNPFSPQTDGTEVVARKSKGSVEVGPDPGLPWMRRASWKWGDPLHFAEEFVKELFDLGILVDLSHVQEHARAHIYDIAQDRQRPVVMSHVGLQHFYAHEYNASDYEIRRIHDLGGIIGLILSKRWLVDPVDLYHAGGNGIPDLMENMLYIANMTGDVSSIAIGSDFDGLTHPFTDCFKPSQLGRIAHAMTKHFTDEQIDQILYGNAQRVFEKGWV